MPTAVEKLELGRAAFARAIKALLVRNGLSHSDFKTLHDWACPEARTWISTSQISGLRTQKLKAPGPRLFDGLGQVNLYLARLAGDNGPATFDLPDRGLLPHNLAHLKERAWCLTHPGSGLPMTAGDLFMVWIGRLDPDIAEEGFSDRQARALTERLALQVQRWIVDHGLLPSEARGQVMDLYGVRSQMRQERLWTALMGGSALDGDQLGEERDDLMQLLGALHCQRGLSPQEWERWVSTGSLPPARTES